MGPLNGLKVVEMAGIGPAPFAGMIFSDLGADVVRIDRPRPPGRADPALDPLNRGRRSVVLDVKIELGRQAAMRLIGQADALIEGFRPGVMERLGLGPDECLATNPRLVYGRVTGWGQDGPLAEMAGHDLDYLAVAGVLRNFARRDEVPVPPLNLVGDFGGGAMFLVAGVLAALLDAGRSGQGQVIDAAMVDGAAALMAIIYGMRAQGMWSGPPGANVLDTGAPYYDVYRTADGEYLAVGALEAGFYAELLDGLGLDPGTLPAQLDESRWPELRARIAETIRTRTRAEWEATFAGSDACVAPVLTMDEAHVHPHNVTRGVFVEDGGLVQPAPAPRFSRTPAAIAGPPCPPGQGASEALADWGFSTDDVTRLRAEGALRS
jgi:alpha-methylacyl-CoA racemase